MSSAVFSKLNGAKNCDLIGVTVYDVNLPHFASALLSETAYTIQAEK
jgi:hypothetical protein